MRQYTLLNRLFRYAFLTEHAQVCHYGFQGFVKYRPAFLGKILARNLNCAACPFIHMLRGGFSVLGKLENAPVELLISAFLCNEPLAFKNSHHS